MRILPQWILTDYPWTITVVDWLTNLKELSQEFQNLFVFVGFWVLWLLLRRERVRLSERIETLRQMVTAVRDQSEDALAEPALEQAAPTAHGTALANRALASTLGNWDAIRTGWRNTRERIELLIEGISRTRVRSKYSKMPRRRYRDIINALEKDGELTLKIANELLRMEALFNRVRFRPSSVTAQEAADFAVSYNVVSKFLPELEAEEPHLATEVELGHSLTGQEEMQVARTASPG